ncbi:DUF732 domain-containing protein [Nocardia huaxiensis]|uniref:DUF732 domain-containing protein n=1 Tax=Nocardia huaxiensis TaxID=2755382 RepID=A0A7D6VCM5_9NOCA|nr:DUF732 domain-containing protein [Nocardia huaxiensis]QLY33241.1 DUF732 domain-containing protein [Nocardia huaxiensis]UFS99824.1 DUF732 domain-containing protein [Nocardia huaxiensis]
MSIFRRLTAATVFAVVTTAACAGAAAADPEREAAFLDEVRAAVPVFSPFIDQRPELLVRDGYIVCDAISQGASMEEIATVFERNINKNGRGAIVVSPAEAREYVDAAARNLC